MKRTVVIAVLALCVVVMASQDALAAQPGAPPPGGALWPQPGGAVAPSKPGTVVLSLVMPGTGEWLNRDFAGQFPIVECVGGYVCFLIQLSSTLDAAAGDRSDKIRIDFWSKPIPER